MSVLRWLVRKFGINLEEARVRSLVLSDDGVSASIKDLGITQEQWTQVFQVFGVKLKNPVQFVQGLRGFEFCSKGAELVATKEVDEDWSFDFHPLYGRTISEWCNHLEASPDSFPERCLRRLSDELAQCSSTMLEDWILADFDYADVHISGDLQLMDHETMAIGLVSLERSLHRNGIWRARAKLAASAFRLPVPDLGRAPFKLWSVLHRCSDKLVQPTPDELPEGIRLEHTYSIDIQMYGLQ